MATSVLGSPSFSANDLMPSGVDLVHVFQLAVTLYERGNVVATSAKVCEGVDVGQPMARDVAVEQPVLSSSLASNGGQDGHITSSASH
jgi:hypothetical protein